MSEQAQTPTLTADDIRHKLVENFEKAKSTLDAYYDYAKTAAALATEYHAARFSECFTTCRHEEMTLVATFDARETPATLDRKLAELGGLQVKLVLFDRVKSTYYLFV